MIYVTYPVPLELEDTPMAPSLRSFTSHDYLGYEGAESLPSGNPPMIGVRDTAEGQMVILVCGDEEREDRVAVSVHRLPPGTGPADREEEWWYAYRATEEGAVDLGTFLMRCFPSLYLSGESSIARDLTALGFRRTL